MINITSHAPSTDLTSWLAQLAGAISDPLTLLAQLEIDPTPWQDGLNARKLFPMRVPKHFVDLMEKGNPYDPLLRQVLPLSEEFDVHDGYSNDPLQEQNDSTNATSGLLHKYKNRALMILKGGCAINCRYCFRRHFPYQENKGNRTIWAQSLAYVKTHPELDELILSGGDPLMAKDNELAWLFEQINLIPHIKTIRIHTRLPVVIPSRLTDDLCAIFKASQAQVVMVTHINHANEISESLQDKITLLKRANVYMLNQSVLLKGVNDSVEQQVALSRRLFQAGILPYYLHVLDKVQGAAHFYISDAQATEIMRGLLQEISGYLVPKLTREEAGKSSKTPLDIGLYE